MLREKQIKYLSLVSMILAVVFSVVAMIAPKDKASSNSKTTSNIETVLDKESVMEINIDINEDDWNWLIDNATDEEYKNVNVTINGETFYNVGLRPKGNSSLRQVASDENSDRYSFKIDFDQYVKGQSYNGIEKLALNNNISDATSMKEYISYDIYNFLGVPTPEYAYANIKVNNKDWGLYLALEVVDERYIEKNYGSLEGNLYKPETMEMKNDKNKAGNAGKEVPMKEGNGEPPEGNNNGNGEIMEGMPEGNMIPNPMENGENGEIPKPPEENEEDETLNKENENTTKSKEKTQNRNQGGPMGGGKNSGGANLKYIDDNAESYSKVRESAVFKSTTDEDFEKVIEMIKNLNEGTNLEEYINVEEVLKYFAVNTYLVNLDSYSGGMYHNYYLYERDGVFEMLPWDLNMSFAGFATGDGAKAVNFPIDSAVTGSLEDAPLIGKLLEVDEYKELYHSYLEQIANEYFGNGTFENTVLKLDKLINSYVKSDPTAFYNYEKYKASIPELINLGKDRTTSVNAQLNGQQPTTEYGTIKTTVDLKALGSQGGGGKKEGGENKNNLNKENTTENNKDTSNENVDKKNDKEMNNEGVTKNEGAIENFNPLDNNAPENMKRNPEEMNNKMLNTRSSAEITGSLSILAVVILILLAALIFVFKFKRKKINN